MDDLGGKPPIFGNIHIVSIQTPMELGLMSLSRIFFMETGYSRENKVFQRLFFSVSFRTAKYVNEVTGPLISWRSSTGAPPPGHVPPRNKGLNSRPY